MKGQVKQKEAQHISKTAGAAKVALGEPNSKASGVQIQLLGTYFSDVYMAEQNATTDLKGRATDPQTLQLVDTV